MRSGSARFDGEAAPDVRVRSEGHQPAGEREMRVEGQCTRNNVDCVCLCVLSVRD